jgi:hypothetical protein
VAAKRDDGSRPDKASDNMLMSSSDISAISRLSPSLLASRLLLMSDQSYEVRFFNDEKLANTLLRFSVLLN